MGSPTAALAFTPDGSPTGRGISAAQAQLRQRPNDLRAHLDLAILFMRHQRETADASLMRYAEDVLASARSLAPADAQVRLLSAMVLQDGHRFEQAARIAREVLASDPSDATAHLVLGDAQLELGDYEGAMDSVQAAIDLHPDLRSYNRAAHLRWLMGDFDSALAIMELAIDSGSPRDPESSAWCFVDLGSMFLHRGDEARALASAERALSLVPSYLPGLALRARALAHRGDTSEAIEILAAVVERKPSVEDLLRLVEWHEAAAEPTAAAQRLAQAERLAQDDPRPMALWLARRGIQTERALALAEAAAEPRSDIATNDALAMAHARAGHHEQAQQAMQRALSLGTADANLHLHAALVDALAGRIETARRSLARAEAIDPAADPSLRAELQQRVGAA
ncbi:MAG: tetratricopeptide repeat protein [Myxococcales bacterium]|nr:tetratricopeptide repeat protein [Myxococcales bacterium]